MVEVMSSVEIVLLIHSFYGVQFELNVLSTSSCK